MKTLTLIIAMLCVNIAFAQDAWQRINPNPQENTITKIIKIHATDKIIAICENSTLMISDDEGETWDIQINPGNLPNNVDLNDISFADAEFGAIACENGMILKTTDGGMNWASITVIDSPLKFIHAFNHNKFLVWKYSDELFITEDGGANWQEITADTYGITNLNFPTDSVGFMSDHQGRFFKTLDGGYHWELVQDLNVITTDLFFLDQEEGYICGFEPVEDIKLLLHTTDGGSTWDTLWQETGYFIVRFVYTENELILIAQKHFNSSRLLSNILTSTDQGNNWLQYLLPILDTYYLNLCQIDATDFILTGAYGLMFKTEDHFYSWTHYNPNPIFGNVNDLQFFNGTAYAATTNHTAGAPEGALYKSQDNGLTWNWVYGEWPVEDIHFLDENTGYCLDYMMLEKSIDGFLNHHTVLNTDSAYDQDLTGIYFFDETTGLIGINDNYNGVIRKTTDGGQSWYDVFSEEEKFARKFLFVSETTGFAVGRPGTFSTALLKTTDAGETWTSWDISNGPFTTDIFFIDEQTGFVTTEYNLYYHTTDGGENWELIELPYDIELNTVFFANDSVGYLAGKAPYHNILKTTNGGENWFPIQQPSTGPIYRMHFFDEDNGMVFGRYGLISKTETGGITGVENHKAPGGKLICSTYPNPFNDEVTIEFSTPPGDDLIIHIYNVQGKLIRTEKPGNLRSYTWNGTDQNGRKLNNGLYLCRISNGRESTTEVVVKVE